MKIVQICNNYSLNGGVGSYVIRVCAALASAGHELNVVYSVEPAALTRGNPQLFHVEGFDAFTNLRKSRIKTAQVMNLLNAVRPDLVHIQSNNNFILEENIRRQFPTVKSLHVYDFCPAGTKFHHALQKPCGHKTGPLCVPRMLYKRCAKDKNPSTLLMFYRRAKAVIENDRRHKTILVASEYVRWHALQNGYRPDQVKVLPYFTALPGVSIAPAAEGGKTILATGRLEPEKGLDRLLYAVSYVRNSGWNLVIDGDGSDRPRLEKLAEKLGLKDRVNFAGWLPPEEHENLYRKAFLVVVPSVWPEPFGLVGIEAMSYAKPVIAFRTGGIPEWMDEGRTGFLIPPYDARRMAEKIDFLLENPDQAGLMGRAGRERVEFFYQPARHTAALTEIYQQAIDAYQFEKVSKSTIGEKQ